MRRLLASPRRRRRLGWSATVLLVAGSIVTAGVLYSRSIDVGEEPLSNTRARLAEQEQPEEPLAPDQADDALGVAGRFILTAVKREHVERSWELTSPELRAGYTRASWSRGEIPIVPYPVHTAKWQVDYTYHDRVGLKVALFPKKGSEVAPAVFNIDLRQLGKGKSRHWVVDAWQPLPERPGGGASTQNAFGIPQVGGIATEDGPRQLSAAWIFVPIGVLSLFLLVGIGIALGAWVRGRRATQQYLRTRAG